MIDDLNTIKKAQAEFIAGIEAKYGKEAVRLQERLIKAINEDLLTKLQVVDGKVVNTPENYKIIYDFENLWQDYQRNYFGATVSSIGNDALKVTSFSDQYFKGLGISGPNAAKLFTQSAKNIELMMGIERVGKEIRFIPNGYLDRLLQGAQIKDQVMGILTDGISVRTGFSDLYRTMQETVVGSPEVDGTMERYFRGYVYDTFSGVQSAYDNYVAQAAGMNSFIYAGTVIKTTREFCAEHVNGIYTREDIAEWETQDWAGKNWDAPFEVARGGYNCRHDLRWIPDELKETFEKRLDKGK